MALGNRDERDLPISDATQELGGLKRKRAGSSANAPEGKLLAMRYARRSGSLEVRRL
jgi:hypothetical protein